MQIKKTFFYLLLVLLGPVQLFAQASKTIVVAKDGSGTYNTVQAALDAVVSGNKMKVTIFVKNGIYKEKILLARGKDFITLLGEDKFSTILTYDDHTGKVGPNGDTINTRTSASFFMLADHFTAENITFQNNAGFTAGQAVALEVDGDKAAFLNCRIMGNQDILFTNNDNSTQYYKNCYLEGTTDFIFGSSTVWFEQCHIHSKKNSHITAASTPKTNRFGYVFNDCVLTADTGLALVSLGRPWRPYASVSYINCYIDRHIRPEGWANWNNTENYKTTRFSEYRNYGPGSAIGGRLGWTKQLTDQEAKEITVENVLGGWKPFLK